MAASTPSSRPSRSRTLRRRALCLGAAGVVVSVVTACGTPGSPAGSAPAAGTVVSTALPSGKTTLTVVSSENSGTTKALAAAFEKAHPNVTVDFRYTAVDDYNKSLNLTLSSDNAPDVALLNMLGTTVKAHLIRPLDPYADAYKWDRKVPGSELDQWRSDDQGKQLGAGRLWAAPAGFSLVGVYWNKELAAKAGITAPPKSFAEFQQDLAKAKAAGLLPVQLGNLQGHSSFIFQTVADTLDGAEASTKWAFGAPGSTIQTAGAATAAGALADWAGKGYLSPGANGTDLPGAVTAFTKGQGVFLFDGNWDATTVDKALGAKAGFFAMPGANATSSVTGIGTSVAYAIPAKAKHPDLAGAFLDFMNSPQAAAIEFRTGFMPVQFSQSVTPDSPGVPLDIVKAWAQVTRDDGLVPFFNNSTQTMNDTLTSQGQQLIGGKASPADYLKALQADWAKGHQ